MKYIFNSWVLILIAVFVLPYGVIFFLEEKLLYSRLVGAFILAYCVGYHFHNKKKLD